MLALLLLILSVGADKPKPTKPAEIIRGKVVAITDGDTIQVLVNKSPVVVRLNAIDAPEMTQPFSSKCKAALSEKIGGKVVAVTVTGKDRYGRTLGDVAIDEDGNPLSVNEWMIEEGWAWHFVKYSSSKSLAKMEADARKGKRGLWADPKPEAPWDYRARKADEREAKRKAKGAKGESIVDGDGLAPADQDEPDSSPMPVEFVHVTKSGKKYHAAGCKHLAKTDMTITLEEAKTRGMEPCDNCLP